MKHRGDIIVFGLGIKGNDVSYAQIWFTRAEMNKRDKICYVMEMLKLRYKKKRSGKDRSKFREEIMQIM